MKLQILDPGDHPTFLDLPWNRPMEGWQHPRLVTIPQGHHRHIVRFADYGGSLYAIKELPEHLARKEFHFLRHLNHVGVPAVDPVGVVTGRGSATHGEGALITRHLDFSLPYRLLLGNERMPHMRDRVLDAFAGLLVRIHLAGFFWGDCSLANALFRRDAGSFTAYVVDTETGELHEKLSNGQRALDLQIAHENVAGGVLEIQASGLGEGLDALETANAVVTKYEGLWGAVTGQEEFAADESFRVAARIHALNELGFDVEEIELDQSPDGTRVHLTPRVVELGFHAPRLHELTGLFTQENQARRLLGDIAYYRALMEHEAGGPVPENIAAARWVDRVFEPTVARIPPEARGKLAAAEVFHQILDHRWYLSQQRGHDVGIDAAADDYVQCILPGVPEERVMFDNDDFAV